MMKNNHLNRSVFIILISFYLGTGSLTAQIGEDEILTILPGETYQTVVGFGGSLAYYENWLPAHPNKNQIYDAIFGELSLDILRVRNAYDYDAGMVDRVQEFVQAAENSLGHPIAVMSTSWGPPGYLKNTGERTNGGTLRYTTDGGGVIFDYAGFAHWWNKALDEYNAYGIYPDYISIQNEPGWAASWETCLLNPTELITASDTIAGYNKALDAVYDTLMTRDQRPAILGPESVGIGYNNVENYVNALDISKLDGICHHLYHGVDEDNPYASTDFTKVGNFHPEVPHWQTEYDRGDWFSLAGLIYKSFYDEKTVAYLYWDLIWNSEGLVTLDNPWMQSSWVYPNGYAKTRTFYAFKQFSAFIHPGWKMTGHTLTGNDGVALTFISPDSDSASCVVINRSDTENITVRVNVPDYRITQSAVYTTSETDKCDHKGGLSDSVLIAPPHSITTVEMKLLAYDPLLDTEDPTVPANLTITDSTVNSLTLTWDPSADNVGVAGYRIFVDGVLNGSSTGVLYTVSDLDFGTAYELTVSAFDDAGNESDLSDPVTGTTTTPDMEAPTTPENVTLSDISETVILVTWDPSMDNVGVRGYRIYLDGVYLATTGGTVYRISMLSPGTTYDITVTAFDDADNESDPSETVSGTTLYFDRETPVLEATDSIYVEGTVEATSSEDGMIYLVPEGTEAELTVIREASLDSLTATAGIAVDIPVSGFANGTYWLFATDSADNISAPEEFIVLGVGIEDYSIGQLNLYPNPFSTTATIEFSLQQDQLIWLEIFDSKGRKVRRELLGHLSAGSQQIPLQRNGLGEGLYLYRLENARGEGWTARLIIRE